MNNESPKLDGASGSQPRASSGARPPRELDQAPSMPRLGNSYESPLQAEHRVHYRLVVGSLGKPITQFGSMRQVLQIMHDALGGHKGAYERANYLHGDVSAQNLIISRDGSGKLVDWEHDF